MVDMVMDWLPVVKEKEPIKIWLEWVGTLRTVTEGKVRAFRHSCLACLINGIDLP